MTEKQRRFADELLRDPERNQTRAYMIAYPRVKNSDVAKAAASRLLTDVNVSAYVKQREDEMSSARIADAREIREYLTRVMRGESESEIVVIEGKDVGVSEARAMQKRPDEKERMKAAELLGKHLGLWSEKQPSTNEDEVKIIRAYDGGIEVDDGT